MYMQTSACTCAYGARPAIVPNFLTELAIPLQRGVWTARASRTHGLEQLS